MADPDVFFILASNMKMSCCLLLRPYFCNALSFYSGFCLLLGLLIPRAGFAQGGATTAEIKSPDGKPVATFSLPPGEGRSGLVYTLTYTGKPIINNAAVLPEEYYAGKNIGRPVLMRNRFQSDNRTNERGNEKKTPESSRVFEKEYSHQYRTHGTNSGPDRISRADG